MVLYALGKEVVLKGVYETVLMIMRRGEKLKKMIEEEVGKV